MSCRVPLLSSCIFTPPFEIDTRECTPGATAGHGTFWVQRNDPCAACAFRKGRIVRWKPRSDSAFTSGSDSDFSAAVLLQKTKRLSSIFFGHPPKDFPAEKDADLGPFLRWGATPSVHGSTDLAQHKQQGNRDCQDDGAKTDENVDHVGMIAFVRRISSPAKLSHARAHLQV